MIHTVLKALTCRYQSDHSAIQWWIRWKEGESLFRAKDRTPSHNDHAFLFDTSHPDPTCGSHIHSLPSPINYPPHLPLSSLFSPSPPQILVNRSLMPSLDEIFSLPLSALDESFGFASWPAPAPIPETGQEERDRASLSLAEERRRRRKISNRESARRSRMRKQRQLEEIRSQVARLRSHNRVLADHLVAAVKRCLIFHADNNRLHAESAALRRRLSQLLCLLRQHHLFSSHPPPPPPPPSPQPSAAAAACVVFAPGYERTFASLMA